MMRLRGRKRLRATVAVGHGEPGQPPSILFGFGVFTIESDLEEAHEFAVQLVDALEAAGRGGSRACDYHDVGGER
jgi:hypothetical protein